MAGTDQEKGRLYIFKSREKENCSEVTVNFNNVCEDFFEIDGLINPFLSLGIKITRQDDFRKIALDAVKNSGETENELRDYHAKLALDEEKEVFRKKFEDDFTQACENSGKERPSEEEIDTQFEKFWKKMALELEKSRVLEVEPSLQRRQQRLLLVVEPSLQRRQQQLLPQRLLQRRQQQLLPQLLLRRISDSQQTHSVITQDLRPVEFDPTLAPDLARHIEENPERASKKLRNRRKKNWKGRKI